MSAPQRLHAHLAGGATTVCRAWALVRRDGVVLGFTDHDRDLAFEGITFRAQTGMSARALQQTTGLSVDNSEAVGALSAAAVTEEDLVAGRFDGAEVQAWLVNWRSVEERILQFRGSLGEIVRAGGSFKAELRGLTEALNRPMGRAYQRGCSAVLGDSECRVDLRQATLSTERAVETVVRGRLFGFEAFPGFADKWFERGRFVVLSGRGQGLVGQIRNDRVTGDGRTIELWEELGLPVVSGDLVRIEAGCDKRGATCRTKFDNFLNFRGFPHIPGEDWLISYPQSSGGNTGGSRA